MKFYKFFFILIIFLLLNSINTENCEMITHKFFLLPLTSDSPNQPGLKKYDYMLILKTEPKGNDKYHLVLNVTFPVNINVDLSTEIIYTFISLEKFCLLDLIKEKGRFVNIFGNLSDSERKNNILERIWIKVENVILFKNVENDRKQSFYLLTNYYEGDKKNKRYFLMNKMFNGVRQNFQIVSTLIYKENENSNYECKNNEDLKDELILSIGDEITIHNLNDILRDDFTYNAFVNNNRYILSQVDNFICLKYQLQNYDEFC